LAYIIFRQTKGETMFQLLFNNNNNSNSAQNCGFLFVVDLI